VSDAAGGVTATEIEAEAGERVSVALAEALGFATLVAVIVTFVLAVMLDGAV